MKANVLLAASGIVYGAAGMALIFAPQEALAALHATGAPIDILVLQLLGSALFGFAMLNWMNRFATIGGIYGRPLVVANLGHTMTAALLALQALRRGASGPLLWTIIIVYGVLALAFGARFMGVSSSVEARS